MLIAIEVAYESTKRTRLTVGLDWVSLESMAQLEPTLSRVLSKIDKTVDVEFAIRP